VIELITGFTLKKFKALKVFCCSTDSTAFQQLDNEPALLNRKRYFPDLWVFYERYFFENY